MVLIVSNYSKWIPHIYIVQVNFDQNNVNHVDGKK
jgi:hypothetical protein